MNHRSWWPFLPFPLKRFVVVVVFVKCKPLVGKEAGFITDDDLQWVGSARVLRHHSKIPLQQQRSCSYSFLIGKELWRKRIWKNSSNEATEATSDLLTPRLLDHMNAFHLQIREEAALELCVWKLSDSTASSDCSSEPFLFLLAFISVAMTWRRRPASPCHPSQVEKPSNSFWLVPFFLHDSNFFTHVPPFYCIFYRTECFFLFSWKWRLQSVQIRAPGQTRDEQMAGMLKMPKIRGRQRHNETKRKQSIHPDLSRKHPWTPRKLFSVGPCRQNVVVEIAPPPNSC